MQNSFFLEKGEEMEDIKILVERLSKEENSFKKFYILFEIARIYHQENEQNLGYPFLIKALTLMEELEKEENKDFEFEYYQAHCRLENGYYSFFYNYKPDIALVELTKALEYFENNCLFNLSINCCSLIGMIYRHFNNYDTTMKYYQKALEIAEHHIIKENNLISLYNEIGNIYCYYKQYDLSLEYHQKALEFAMLKEDTHFLEYIYNDFGVVYTYLENYQKALEYFLEARKLIKPSDTRAIIISESNIASCYTSLGVYDRALQTQLSLEKYPIIFENNFLYETHCSTLSSIYNRLQQYDKAYVYLKKSILCNHVIHNQEMIKLISDLQAKFEVKNKEQEAEIYRLRNIELVESNEKLTLHQDHLKMVNRILRHDLINQIAAALSAINMYKSNPSEEILKEAELKSTKSLELIQRMRDLEEFMLQRLDLKLYNLQAVLENVALNYPNLEIEMNDNAEVLGDDAIYSVFSNLLSNAITHGKATKVIIKVTSQVNFCQIEVLDNGIGIPDSLKERVFDEFFSYGKNAQTGLGLYIVKKAVERYGGYIYILDNLPNGANFVLKLKQVR
jgi:signal transduction histidine kinase